MNKPLAALALVITGAVIILASDGQTFARVDAGGPSLRILMTGQGGPTVVFEAGAGSPLDTWVRVQPEVARFARTISYDRAGNGLSTKGPTPRDGRHVAAELHAALHNAHVAPPYILVGHSLGGPYIRIFAGMFPGEVAGLVLVDPTQEELIAWSKSRKPESQEKRPPRPEDEVDCAPATFAQARDLVMPPGIPVVLISGVGPRAAPGFLPSELRKEVDEDQKTLYPAKLKFHKEWVEKFPGGRLVVTPESGHGIPYEEPGLVIRTIREVVEQARRRAAAGVR